MTQLFIAFGSLLALTGVVARSLSAHALLQLLEARGKLDNFNLAADYLLFHGLALIGIAILCHLFPEGKYHHAGWAFLLGSILFQGTVLTKSFISIQPFGFLTPLGGFVLMAGWGLLIIAALQGYFAGR
ncbi:DUF423 domain-containing protein [Desulfopila sp. IMCC35006]|uniref:DUF423 domain-containing protein n=1 Tax=Desulfopila sp. IMCC35006 TaxID=2569542 RepID=UPI0010ABDF21|nr:DUF423 domain-containing protein [Desulfopila sp. IMCC35006]TKB23236.1 DUF423 domain-containing protein [Desulfopila sp. IMCC35006]